MHAAYTCILQYSDSTLLIKLTWNTFLFMLFAGNNNNYKHIKQVYKKLSIEYETTTNIIITIIIITQVLIWKHATYKKQRKKDVGRGKYNFDRLRIELKW